jgi:hypothetical protein
VKKTPVVGQVMKTTVEAPAKKTPETVKRRRPQEKVE